MERQVPALAGHDKSGSRHAAPGPRCSSHGRKRCTDDGPESREMAQTWRQARRPERQSRTFAEQQSTDGSDPTIGGNAGTDPIGIEIGGQVWIT